PIAVDTTLAIATTAKDESISAIQQPGKPLGVDVSVSAGSHLKSSPATTDTAQVTVPTAIADQGIASGWASTDSDRRPAFSAGGPAKENQLLAEPLTPPGGPPMVALSGSTGSTDRAAPIDEVPRTATVVKNAKEAAGPLPMSDRQAASILFREPIGGPSPDAVTMPSTTRPEAMVETVAAIRPEGSVGPTHNGPLTQASSPSPSPALSDAPADHAALPAAPGLLNLNQKNWERMLGHQLNWVVNNRLPEAEIKVNPPDLGPLEVRVSLRHNQTDVAFFSHEAAVREALENALPRLREMLDSQGINLNQAQVFDQSSARQQAGAGEQFASGQRGGSSTPTPDSEPVIEETKSAPRSRGLLGMVDDYA
ncbi:MAG: flagellar hook-length control protein FliK, partial [Candidatus Competibacter sp.]